MYTHMLRIHFHFLTFDLLYIWDVFSVRNVYFLMAPAICEGQLHFYPEHIFQHNINEGFGDVFRVILYRVHPICIQRTVALSRTFALAHLLCSPV